MLTSKTRVATKKNTWLVWNPNVRHPSGPKGYVGTVAQSVVGLRIPPPPHPPPRTTPPHTAIPTPARGGSVACVAHQGSAGTRWRGGRPARAPSRPAPRPPPRSTPRPQGGTGSLGECKPGWTSLQHRLDTTTMPAGHHYNTGWTPLQTRLGTVTTPAGHQCHRGGAPVEVTGRGGSLDMRL